MNKSFFLLAACALPAAAAPSPSITYLDSDKDGRISRPELMSGVQFWAETDTNLTLLRDHAAAPPATVEAAGISKDTKEIHYPYFLRKHKLKDLPFHSAASIDPAWFPLEKAEMRPAREPDATTPWVRVKDSPLLKVRRDVDDLTAEGPDQKGALLSFSHDFTASADQWLARGIISVGGDWEQNGLWREAHPEANPFWNSYGLHANMLVDRVDGTGGPETETDVLQFSVSGSGLTRNLAEGASLLVKADLVDSTSFDFDRHLLGGTFELEPVIPGAGLHGIIRGPFGSYTGRLKLRVEGGGLASGNDDPASHKDDDFLRIGPVAEVSFYPGIVRDNLLKFYAKGSLLAALTGEEESRLFVAGAAYTLPFTLFKSRYDSGDVNGKLSLNVEYRNGELPFSAQKDESLVIGLGILF